MDYEKNKTIAIMKQMVADGKITQADAEKYCPELAESEDEKMMNQLHSWMKEFGGAEEYTEKVYQRIKGLLEKQGEQPADKVEPKFKVGKWYQCTEDFFGKGVTFNKNTAYYCAKEGCLQNEYGCHIAIDKKLYDNFKLWTIQDAKDGDVLYESCNDSILLFKSKACGWIKVYCDYWINKDKFTGTDHDDYGRLSEMSLSPTNKERRDLLFQKMKEAGYEWDAEKKELKKIEQTPVIEMKTPEQSLGIDSDTYNKIVDECVYGEQNPAWSEEDEVNLNEALSYIKDDALKEFIKSLKNRVQPKQEWSEEEVEIIDWLVASFDSLKIPTDTFYLSKVRPFLISLRNKIQPIINEWSEEDEKNFARVDYACLKLYGGDSYSSDWLRKFLGIHKKWKPSEEQITVLHDVAAYIDNSIYPNQKDILVNLYQQLKKL